MADDGNLSLWFCFNQLLLYELDLAFNSLFMFQSSLLQTDAAFYIWQILGLLTPKLHFNRVEVEFYSSWSLLCVKCVYYLMKLYDFIMTITIVITVNKAFSIINKLP